MKDTDHHDKSPDLDAIFAALADPTRRAILVKLAAGEATVNQLTEPFEMSQPAISKHLRVLERAGLVEQIIDAQRRPRRLNAKNMAVAVEFLNEFKHFWGSNFEQLNKVLMTLKQDGKHD